MFAIVNQRKWASVQGFETPISAEYFPLTQQYECYASTFNLCLYPPGLHVADQRVVFQIWPRLVSHTPHTWWVAMVLEYHGNLQIWWNGFGSGFFARIMKYRRVLWCVGGTLILVLRENLVITFFLSLKDFALSNIKIYVQLRV